MSKITHQICIIGAGPVGLALANCLALSPYIQSIALIDRKLPKLMTTPYTIPNQRVFSINAPSLKLLDHIGALPRIRQYGNLSNIQVVSKQSESFLQWDQGKAKIVENDELVNSLLSNLEQPALKNKIEFIEGEIQGFNNDVYSQCVVQLKDTKISTKLLVGSDGNRSKVKQLAHIPTYGWSYRQKAIACTLSMQGLNESNNRSAFQVYHDSNILGILPLWKDYVSIVWSLQIPDFQHLMQLEDKLFVQSLNHLIENSNRAHGGKANYRQIGLIQGLVNKRMAFPLSTLQAEHYSQHRLALIGEAAHSIHPMAGLGVNSGLADAILLANNVIFSKKTGNDIGQAVSLSNFQSKSKAMNYGNSVAMEAIKKGFEVDFGPINKLRETVLNLFQSSSSVKTSMRGLVQDNPLTQIPRYEWEHV